MSHSDAPAPTPVISTRINEHDHGAAIIIAAGVVFGTTFMALCLRLFQRWPWTKSLKLEDILLVTATALEIANVSALSWGVTVGLGQKRERLEDDHVAKSRQALIASFALTFLTEGFSATSYVWLLRSMNPCPMYHRAMEGICGLVVAWSVAGVARFAASSITTVPEPSLVTWIAFGAVSMAIQLTLMGSAFWTIWRLQMPLQRKAGLSLWFSLSLLVVAITIIRLVHTPHRTLTGDFTWDDTNMVIISVVESNLTIINAAYPSVRAFLIKVSTGFIVADMSTGSRSQGKSQGKSQSYVLQSIGGGAKGIAAKVKDPQLGFGDKRTATHSTAVKGDTGSDRSFGSEVIMVRRSIEVDQTSMAESHDMAR